MTRFGASPNDRRALSSFASTITAKEAILLRAAR
jgi:hypothetical protein